FTVVFAGAVVLALPQVAIGLARVTPLWALPLVACLGAAILALFAARRPVVARWASVLAAALLPVAALFLHARRQSDFFTDDWHDYGMLTLLGGLGIVAG